MEGAVSSSLPPGPRVPRWLQTAGFIFQSARWVDANRRRYGDMVTFRTLFDPCFVMVFDPDLVKQVFRGKPNRLRAGEANAVLGPVVGDHSLLLLDGAEHLREMQSLTLDVILRAVFGVGEGPRLEELKRRIREMIEPTSNRIGLLLFALSGGRFGAGVG